MGEVIHLQGKRTFTLNQARELLPVVRKITGATIERTERILFRMESLDRGNDERKQLESELNQLIEDWVGKIERLGCEAKGLWLVDFDSGGGYFCWQYGEDDIGFFHDYG
jgi:hypothetical protein